MPRINVEESIYSDPRFQDFCIAVGNKYLAIGYMVGAWTLAQRYWCPGRLAIPENEFKASGLPDALIQCRLAESSSDGIRIKGSEDHFAWWFKRQEAGRLGGLAKASNAKQTLANVYQNVANLPSSSSSSSSSFSNSSSEDKIQILSAVVKPTTRRERKIFRPESLDQLKASITSETTALWKTLYPDDAYRRREAVRCWAYYRDNTRKCPATLSGWTRVFGSWFERGWAKHIASVPGIGSVGRSLGPAPIKYEDAEAVIAEMESSRDELSDADRVAAAKKVRELLANAGNLGHHESPVS